MNDQDQLERLLQQVELNQVMHHSLDSIRQQLEIKINYLIDTDFEQLVQILYRKDVDEEKLKLALQRHPTQDAGGMIADLLIERICQTIQNRKQFKQTPPANPDEAW